MKSSITPTTHKKLDWVTLSFARSSVVKAMAWKRYSLDATATRDQNPKGAMFLSFRSSPQYIYAYYEVGYRQYRYLMDNTKSIGLYINRYLHPRNNKSPKFRYRRIYL